MFGGPRLLAENNVPDRDRALRPAVVARGCSRELPTAQKFERSGMRFISRLETGQLNHRKWLMRQKLEHREQRIPLE
jgi:hypothetical protein